MEFLGSSFIQDKPSCGIPIDCARGVELLHRAAELGHSGAKYQLAVMYDRGVLGVRHNAERALRFYQESAEAGDVDAQFNLGLSYRQSDIVAADFGLARFWLQKAADQGHIKAMGNLAILYMSGSGVERSYCKAKLLFEQAATFGDPTALLNLAHLYQTGVPGTEKDEPRAFGYMQRGATLGSASHMYYLADCYMHGKGVSRDGHMALKWWQRAADAGEPHAAEELGMIYFSGNSELGVAADRRSAFEYWNVGATRGNLFASQLQAARMLLLGHDVPQNLELALKFCKQALVSVSKGAPDRNRDHQQKMASGLNESIKRELARQKARRCDACQQAETAAGQFLKCDACRVARYCGTACQREHWKAHKIECPRLKAEEEDDIRDTFRLSSTSSRTETWLVEF